MQAWRRAFQSNEARFVCVCVDGRAEATAREFQRLYFDRDMINAFIDANADFPRFQTQLGCQGLVVIDAEGCFATQRSPAFLDHRNEAFRFVESAVRALASARSTTASRDRDGGESNASASAKVDVARFAENACAETPVDLDDTEALVCTKLPFVGHSKMDSDHAEIERLMRRALASVTARDARALTEAFSKHAAEEEALLRDAEDMRHKKERHVRFARHLRTLPTTREFYRSYVWPSPRRRRTITKRKFRVKSSKPRVEQSWNTP